MAAVAGIVVLVAAPRGTSAAEAGGPLRPSDVNPRYFADAAGKIVYLAAMTPREDLASSRYCLANPGEEYLVYVPSGEVFTVNLSQTSDEFRVEWINPRTGALSPGPTVRGGGSRRLEPPRSGDAVLHLLLIPARPMNASTSSQAQGLQPLGLARDHWPCRAQSAPPRTATSAAGMLLPCAVSAAV